MVRRGVKGAVLGLLAALCLLAGAGAAQAATLQPIGHFESPIYVTSDPGNPERLFVVERAGEIIEAENGGQHTFADLRSLVGCCVEEQGLLSIALAPDFDSSGRLFVDYTDQAEPGAIHVAEMRASGDQVPLASLRNLLTIQHPENTNHYAGQLQFGPEGLLYISTGDGGGANDQHHNSQDPNSLLGKILRIGTEPSGALPYTLPPGQANPVFSLGLRNPFRFSFDRLTHGLWIGDVGQDAQEEVDYGPPPGLGMGANYGWNCREGTIEGPADDPQCATLLPSAFTAPVFSYPHTNPGGGAAHGCAIIGGYLVRDPSLGSLYGRYLYGDLCEGELRSFAPAEPAASDRWEGLKVENLNSFGEDSCGRLYAVSGSGTVSRLVGPTANACLSSAAATPRAASAVGIRAVRNKVPKRGRALISTWVSPCGASRRGEPVKLYRGSVAVATRHLDRACSARFRPKVLHPVSFRTAVAEDSSYVAATSRKLKIRIDQSRKRKHASSRRRTALHLPPGVHR